MFQGIKRFKGYLNYFSSFNTHQTKLASTAEPELGTAQPQLVIQFDTMREGGGGSYYNPDQNCWYLTKFIFLITICKWMYRFDTAF